MKIAIVVPAYNEGDNIVHMVDELTKIKKQIKEEMDIIFVNDGSKDHTAEEIVKCAKEKDYVKLIHFSRNFGKEAALLAGLDYATDYDAVITIDADLEMPVSYIIELIEKWHEGYKLVLTKRRKRAKGIRNYCSAKYYKVYNRLTGSELEQNAMDYQLLDKEVVHTILKYREYNRFYKGITGLIGYDRAVVLVDLDQRLHGESKFGNPITLMQYGVASIISHTRVPLIISFYLGLLTTLIAFIYGTNIIISTIVSGKSVPGYASIMAVILFSTGIISMFLGIIGYYIGLIYEEGKKRPAYIVAETVNIEDENDN